MTVCSMKNPIELTLNLSTQKLLQKWFASLAARNLNRRSTVFSKVYSLIKMIILSLVEAHMTLPSNGEL